METVFSPPGSVNTSARPSNEGLGRCRLHQSLAAIDLDLGLDGLALIKTQMDGRPGTGILPLTAFRNCLHFHSAGMKVLSKGALAWGRL